MGKASRQRKQQEKYDPENPLVGSRITVKVTLHNYRYPRKKAPVSGEFAIVIFDVKQIIKGTLDEGCYLFKDGIVGTGRMPRIEEGMEYFFTGTLVMNKDWGPQYECESIQLAYDMKNEEDQKKFFSFFMTEKQIDALFAASKNPIEWLEQKNLGALTQIKGVGQVTAIRMCNRYSENINNGHAYVELKELGLTKHAIDNLIVQFGSADIVVDIIKQNPYSLITLAKGYGWEKADQIALNRGFTTGCKERCLAYAFYKLEKAAYEDGNSRVDIGEFMDIVSQICAPTTKEQIANWIKENTIGEEGFEDLYKRIQKGEENLPHPFFFYSKEKKGIALYSLRLMEKQISTELQRLSNARGLYSFNEEICNQVIDETEQEQGYEYTNEQKNAIQNILHSNVSILTGKSGVGKSSTLKPLIRVFKRFHLSVAQCALSGRASSLLTEYTGLEGKTIHRLLNYLPDQERFNHNAKNPLKYDVIILDETSMVGEELFLSLISSIRSGSKLIMLGDTQQLPPMSVGNVLGDCISSGYISTNILTKIHRQALKSGIITQASKISLGDPIIKNDFLGEDVRGELKDFKIIGDPDSSVVHYKAMGEFKRLYEKEHISIDDIQIIVPMRVRGMNSCRFFNAEVQSLVNGDMNKKSVNMEVTDGMQKYTVTYKPDDRILVTKNNYHAMTTSGKEVAIFNGNIGRIVDLDRENMIIRLQNLQEDVIIPRGNWYDISHSYAVTCHKCQGGQAPYVIVVLDNSAYTLLMREWLYTAITRARKFCTLVGQPRAINTATRISDIKIKKTWLKDDLYKLYLAKIDQE